MKANVSLAALPGMSFFEAMMRASKGLDEPLLGRLSVDDVQLCPQNSGILYEDIAKALVLAFPGTRFRLHANVRVLGRRLVNDLDTFDEDSEYWLQIAKVSNLLSAPAYTAHAGLKRNATLAQVFDNTRRAQDFLGIQVGVEGHYPTERGIYLLDSWQCYRTLLESGIPYALDLSHLHIVATTNGLEGWGGLVGELLASPACIEIHLSVNDGKRDGHQCLTDNPPWWWPMLGKANPAATIFSEGVQPRTH